MIKSLINKLLKLASPADMLAYKVMKIEEDYLVSGANSRLRVPLRKGELIKFPPPGIYLTLNKQYALDYYSGLADQEVIIQVLFNPKDVLVGSLTDRDTEFAVSKCTLLGWQLL